MARAMLHAGAERLGRGRCGACNILRQLAFEHLVGVDGASEPGCMRGAVGTHNVSGCRSRRLALCAQRLGDVHPPSPLQEWHEARVFAEHAGVCMRNGCVPCTVVSMVRSVPVEQSGL